MSELTWQQFLNLVRSCHFMTVDEEEEPDIVTVVLDGTNYVLRSETDSLDGEIIQPKAYEVKDR